MSASARDIARLTQRATNRPWVLLICRLLNWRPACNIWPLSHSFCQALPLLCCAALFNTRANNPTARHDPDAPRRGRLYSRRVRARSPHEGRRADRGVHPSALGGKSESARLVFSTAALMLKAAAPRASSEGMAPPHSSPGTTKWCQDWPAVGHL